MGGAFKYRHRGVPGTRVYRGLGDGLMGEVQTIISAVMQTMTRTAVSGNVQCYRNTSNFTLHIHTCIHTKYTKAHVCMDSW